MVTNENGNTFRPFRQNAALQCKLFPDFTVVRDTIEEITPGVSTTKVSDDRWSHPVHF